MNILIVEDEKGLALEMDEFLSREGFTVEHARTRKSAEEKIFVNNTILFCLIWAFLTAMGWMY